MFKTAIAAAFIVSLGMLLVTPAQARPPVDTPPPDPTETPIPTPTSTPVPTATSTPTPVITLADVTGYPCSTTYTRQDNVGLGNGWASVTLTSQPFCAGSYVAQLFILGPGAARPGFQHDETERLALFARAHRAAIAGTRATYFCDTTGGGIFHTTYYGN
jgi:hypothetical protein